jgi:AraC family transcriptional activator of tynA and feaB
MQQCDGASTAEADMAQISGNEQFQQWLAQINQECGNFAARPLDGEFSGHLETGYTRALKLSTVTTANVNLYRTQNEIKDHNDSWFYTVFQLEGQAIIEQHDRQTVIQPGDITLVDASRPCSMVWQQPSRQISLLLPRSLLEQQLRVGEAHCVRRLGKNLPMVQMSHRLLLESMTKNWPGSALAGDLPITAIFPLRFASVLACRRGNTVSAIVADKTPADRAYEAGRRH